METIRSEFRGCLKEAQDKGEPSGSLSSLASGITCQIHNLRDVGSLFGWQPSLNIIGHTMTHGISLNSGVIDISSQEEWNKTLCGGPFAICELRIWFPCWTPQMAACPPLAPAAVQCTSVRSPLWTRWSRPPGPPGCSLCPSAWRRRTSAQSRWCMRRNLIAKQRRHRWHPGHWRQSWQGHRELQELQGVWANPFNDWWSMLLLASSRDRCLEMEDTDGFRGCRLSAHLNPAC